MTTPPSRPHTPPPPAPGSLTAAPSGAEILAYLSKVTAWRDELTASLERLDGRARVATSADDLTADMALAFALLKSIAARVDEIVAAWDSGRVGQLERDRVAQLIWGRLGGSLDGALAVSFSEACVLADALTERLADRLDGDALAAVGVGDVIAEVTDTLVRCHTHDVSGSRASEIEQLETRLAEAVAEARDGGDPKSALAQLRKDTAALERDLIVGAAAMAAIGRDHADLERRVLAVCAAAEDLRELAARCTAKIADPPRLAIPQPSALGAVPAPDRDWRATRAAIDSFEQRLDLVERAVAEASARYAAPLSRRSELRGLCDAYWNMAQRHRLSEDERTATAHRLAAGLLWSAPLDIVAAEGVVSAFEAVVKDRIRAVTAAQARPRTDQTDDPDAAAPAPDVEEL